MLLRSLLTGLRTCSLHGLATAASRTAFLAAPGSTAFSAAAAAASRTALAMFCSMSTGSSLAGPRCATQIGSAAARTALGSSSSMTTAAAGSSSSGVGHVWARQQLLQLRSRTTSSHLTPKFKGGKIKSYSSYKSRFRVTGTGKVLYARPGHVHKRFSKSKRQLFDLSQYQSLTPRYAKTVKKIGFKMRKF